MASYPMFDGKRYQVVCDNCGRREGGGANVYDPRDSGLPKGWNVTYSRAKGAYFFSCGEKCWGEMLGLLKRELLT